MRPQLEFSCPESWEKMTPADGGRFCGSCEKVVTDFSGMNDAEIISTIRNSKTQLCGRFRNEQLEKPFGDYRDRVLQLYRKAQSIPEKKYFAKAVMMMLAASLIFVTGCHRKIYRHTTQGYANVRQFPKPPAKHQKKGKW